MPQKQCGPSEVARRRTRISPALCLQKPLRLLTHRSGWRRTKLWLADISADFFLVHVGPYSRTTAWKARWTRAAVVVRAVGFVGKWGAGASSNGSVVLVPPLYMCLGSWNPRGSIYPNILIISLLPCKETVVARSHQLPGSDYSVSYNPRTWLATSDLPRATHPMVLQNAKRRYNHFTPSAACTSKYLRPK